MFFGRGDTSKLAEDEKVTLAHLRRMVETGHIVALSEEQAMIAMRALDQYAQWESVLRLGKSLRNTLLLVGFFLGLWWVAEDKVVALLSAMSGG